MKNNLYLFILFPKLHQIITWGRKKSFVDDLAIQSKEITSGIYTIFYFINKEELLDVTLWVNFLRPDENRWKMLSDICEKFIII